MSPPRDAQRSSVELQRGLPFRRRMFKARHRKSSPLARLAKPFLGASLLVGSPAALAAWVMTTPEFALRDVEVEGAVHVPAEWIEAELAGLRGYQLFDIPAELVEGRLAAHPWVEEARVRKRLPDRLRVELIERRPAALLRRDGELIFVDLNGVAFAPFDASVGTGDLLLLSGSEAAADLRAAMRLAAVVDRVAPHWSGTLSEVEVINHTDFRLFCSVLPFPLVVAYDRLEEGLASLLEHLGEIEPHFESIGAVDLRFERYIVIQPGKGKVTRHGETE